MQLEQAIHLLEALTSRQDETETQVAKIDERTQRLTSAHGEDVQEMVHLIAAAIVKQSPNITTQLAHSMVFGRLKRRFRARSYIEIPDERFDEVMAYLRGELRKFAGGDVPGRLRQPASAARRARPAGRVLSHRARRHRHARLGARGE